MSSPLALLDTTNFLVELVDIHISLVSVRFNDAHLQRVRCTLYRLHSRCATSSPACWPLKRCSALVAIAISSYATHCCLYASQQFSKSLRSSTTISIRISIWSRHWTLPEQWSIEQRSALIGNSFSRRITNSVSTIVLCIHRRTHDTFYWYKCISVWCTWESSLKC